MPRVEGHSIQLMETAGMVLVGAGASALCSLGRRLITQITPKLDQSFLFVTLFPQAPPLMKSLVWGAFLGVYLKTAFTIFPEPDRRRFFEMFLHAGIASSFSMGFLLKEGVPSNRDTDAMMRPFAYLFLGRVAHLISRQRLQNRIQY